MKIFFDTEFTNLYVVDGIDIMLISAGFVASDGREFYFEIQDGYQQRDCSQFVIQEVLPHLDNAKYGMFSSQAASRLRDWLESFNEPVELLSDSPGHDWTLISSLLNNEDCWPVNLERNQPINMTFDFDQDMYEKFDHAISQFFDSQPEAIRHHALWDAKANAVGWKAVGN